jgi:hypothetical protein
MMIVCLERTTNGLVGSGTEADKHCCTSLTCESTSVIIDCTCVFLGWLYPRLEVSRCASSTAAMKLAGFIEALYTQTPLPHPPYAIFRDQLLHSLFKP